MIMEQPQSNPVETYLEGLSSRNERTAREALDEMARRIRWKGSAKGKGKQSALSAPWWELNQDDVRKVYDQLSSGEWLSEVTGEPYAATGVNRFISALRGVLRQCWRQGMMPADTYLGAVSQLKTVPARVSR